MQDWDVFRYLLAIFREGGLSGAARALGVTHATVSRKLARAEEILGAKLFDRLPGGLIATPAGEAAIRRAEGMEAELFALDLNLMDQEGGPLGITVPPLIMRGHIANDLRDFAAQHPGMQLSIYSDNRLFDLHRREADLAIRVTRTPAESLWGRKVIDQRAGYFSSKPFLDEHRAAIEAGSGRIPVIGFPRWPAPVPKELTRVLPGAFRYVTCDDMFAAIELLKAGFGITRIPLYVARNEPALVRIESLPMPDYGPIWLLTHPDLRRTPLVRRAMRFLAERFDRAAPLYREP